MTVQAAQLVATISVIGADKAKADLASTGAAADAAGTNLQKSLAMGAALAGVAVVALAAKTVSMAGNFNAGITTLKTGAGELQSNLGMVSSGLLKMAVDTGTSTQQLISGMFQVESAGYRGAQALMVMQTAAEGAKVGNADLGTVANAVTTVMKDYSISANNSANAMNFLTGIVQNGKTTLQDLAASMSSVLPTASALHVRLIDVGGAMATMTGEGVPAADAATYLRQMLMSLASPASAGAKSLQAIGLSAQQVSVDMKKDLPATLQLIMKHLAETYQVGSPQYVAALKNIAGGSKQMQGFLDLTGAHLKDFGDNVKNVAGVMDKGKGSVVGWSDVQKDFNFKLDQAKEVAETLGIKIGTALLPAVGNLVSGIANIVPKFADWISKSNLLQPILIGLGAMLVSMIVPAVWSLAAGVIAATWPFLAIGAAVAAAVAIFQHFYTTNAGFKSFIDGIVNGIKQAASFIQANFIPAMQQIGSFLRANVLPILQQIGGFLAATFLPIWKQLQQLWSGQIVPLMKQLWGALQPALPAFEMLGKIIGGIVVVAFGLLVGIITGVVKAIAGIISGVVTVIGGIVQFFTGIVQVISGVVRFIYDLLTGNFGKLKGDLGAIWQGIVNMFEGVWNVIKGIFQGAWNAISGFVSGLVQGVIGFFTHLWNELVGHSIIPDMINGIINFFASLPGRLFAIIGNLITWLLDKWNMLKSAAIVVVQGMVSGIGNAFSNLGSTISGIWNGIVGGIKSAINWIIGLIDGFINGINSMGVDVGPVHIHPHIPTIPYLASGGTIGQAGFAMVGERGPEPVWLPAGAQVFPNSSLPNFTGAASGNGQPVILQIDGRQFARVILPHLANHLRYAVGTHGI